MQNDYFGSDITRKIWGDIENILLIYVGTAAEFPLIHENHWLFKNLTFTQNPQQRFVNTFLYNQTLFFSPKQQVPQMLIAIRAIHQRLEARQETSISNHAFIEVLSMLVEYGIQGYQYLHRTTLNSSEIEAYYQDIHVIAQGMQIKDFPPTYATFCEYRAQHIQTQLTKNLYTTKFYNIYQQDLGKWRYWILCQFQAYFVAPAISQRLELHRHPLFYLGYWAYPYLRCAWLLGLILRLLVKPDVVTALTAFKHMAQPKHRF
ncbi:oxygenase MpaB family protein [Beggiatoa leptomitoformis]|uniref:DUF2236 domain-containing protein n=1 Tax=Beggiatoa leptomitoformis TaxID=288004 RepID=A0A2N9YIH0_9GAMM|nr:oxygenase MpaB family protein [Beggiatoa leptomitoformis]ALG67476.1 DUF2236 domain-containing protein [Beggiatoa leptomitoformis]AUI70307.1 DUF2236 domain-containing protein [Beggiatoa leptomitoformis]